MSAKGIDCGIHFVPVHRHEYFKDARRGDLSVTELVVGEVTTLPLHSDMRPEFVERVIDGVRSFVA
jgi:dTDP-4-amino-4,6-dideoxygalactose transaminase